MQTVLLVDDDNDFMVLVSRAMQKSGLNASLQYVEDGEQAISYLSREGKFKDEKAFLSPSVVLLDVKMPRLTGFDVLQWRSSRAELKDIPFVVLSSSEMKSDIDRCSQLGARDYFAKPMDFRGLVEIVGRLQAFWSKE